MFLYREMKRMKKHRLDLLKKIYINAKVNNDIYRPYKLVDYEVYKFDYQYLHSKGYIDVCASGYARLTISGLEVAETTFSDVELIHELAKANLEISEEITERVDALFARTIFNEPLRSRMRLDYIM